MPRTFAMTCDLSVSLAIDRIRELLVKNGINVQNSDQYIQSINIPIILWNWSKYKFSRSNWVGINPFVDISEIEIQVQPYKETGSKLNVGLNQLRGYVYVALTALIGVSVAIAPLTPTLVKFVFLIAFPCIVWLFQVPLVRYLIRKELQNALNR